MIVRYMKIVMDRRRTNTEYAFSIYVSGTRSGIFQSLRDGTDVFQKLLHQGVIVRPLANYGMPSYLRVSIGLESENFRFIEALTILRKGGFL